MATYRIDRRIANTDQWNVIDHADSRDAAIAAATRGDRRSYAGVRIVPMTGDDEIDAYATPEIAVECGLAVCLGDRVEGGERGTEDHDTGVVDSIDGDQVTVRWDSHVVTTQHASLLRRI